MKTQDRNDKNRQAIDIKKAKIHLGKMVLISVYERMQKQPNQKDIHGFGLWKLEPFDLEMNDFTMNLYAELLQDLLKKKR